MVRCYVCGQVILQGEKWGQKPINGGDDKLNFHLSCKQQREMREQPIEELAQSAREVH